MKFTGGFRSHSKHETFFPSSFLSRYIIFTLRLNKNGILFSNLVFPDICFVSHKKIWVECFFCLIYFFHSFTVILCHFVAYYMLHRKSCFYSSFLIFILFIFFVFLWQNIEYKEEKRKIHSNIRCLLWFDVNWKIVEKTEISKYRENISWLLIQQLDDWFSI